MLAEVGSRVATDTAKFEVCRLFVFYWALAIGQLAGVIGGTDIQVFVMVGFLENLASVAF